MKANNKAVSAESGTIQKILLIMIFVLN
jgi:hypothetical protein